MKAVDCDLGDIAFLKQVESLTSVHLERCSFSSTENMRSSTKYCGTVVIQDAKSAVDLSFVRDMNGFENGYIEVDGKMVASYLGGLETIDIRGSRVKNLSALGQCRQLKKVVYTVADLSGKDRAWLLDLRAQRGEGEIELQDGTRECIDKVVREAERNPLPEHVKRVVQTGGDVKALWRQYWLRYGRNPDIAYVGAMLENGADINEQMQFGTALGQLVNCQDEKGRTNRVAVMTALLERGADPNAEPKYDRSVLADVLCGPSYTGRVELVKLLLAKGADPNRADRMGKTAIDGLFTFGIDDEGLELAKLLLAHGADVKGRSLLGSMRRWKLASGKFELVKTLVEKGVAIDQLAIGAAWPDLEIRRYLLQKTNTDESEYEVTEHEGGFNIRTGGKRDNRQIRRDQELRFARERERQLRRMDEHHRHEMAHLNDMRERRHAEEECSRQDGERQSMEGVEIARQRLEESRRELLGRVNPSKRDTIAKWLEERRADEKTRLDEILATCKAEEERGRQLTETAHAEEVARERAQSEMRRKEEAARLRRMQGNGMPEHLLREHEFMERVREMHERNWRERDEALGVRNRRFDSGSRLPSALSEYRRWLERRIEDEYKKAFEGTVVPHRMF